MPSEFDVAYFVGSLVSVGVFAFAAYTAFGIRRTLSGKTYRDQALGIGLVAGLFAVDLLNNFVYSYIPPNTPANTLDNNLGPIGLPVFLALLFVLFYWVDESVLASRRADPLFRDTLRWNSARKVLRPWVAFSALLFGLTFIVGEAVNQPSGAGAPPLFLAPFEVTLVLGVPIMGIILLPISALRARDPLLRRQLYWFGAFAIAYLSDGFDQALISNPSWAVLGAFPLGIAAGFFLYKSAKSLVPLYRFSNEPSVNN